MFRNTWNPYLSEKLFKPLEPFNHTPEQEPERSHHQNSRMRPSIFRRSKIKLKFCVVLEHKRTTDPGQWVNYGRSSAFGTPPEIETVRATDERSSIGSSFYEILRFLPNHFFLMVKYFFELIEFSNFRKI